MDVWKKPNLMLILAVGGILLFGVGSALRETNPVEASDIPPQIAVSEAQPTPAVEPSLPKELPIAFSQMIPFDGIFPIYAPQFVSAEESPFEDDELILGIAWDGEAKAYPITVLRFREMVNDELAGIPTLVTY